MEKEKFNEIALLVILGIITFIFGIFCGIKLSYDNYKKLNQDNFYCQRN